VSAGKEQRRRRWRLPFWAVRLRAVASLILGIILTAAAALADFVWPGSAAGFGRAQTLGIFLGLYLLLNGMLWRQRNELRGALGALFLGILVLAASADLVSEGLMRIGLASPRQAGGGGGAALLEFEEGTGFSPFLLWGSPLRGDSSPDVSRGSRVVVLGGCEACMDAGDGGGVAALVEEGLSLRGFEAVSLARPFYNSAQSLVSLVLFLAGGGRPGFVLLLMGPEDVYCAFESGQPGVPCGRWQTGEAAAAFLEKREVEAGGFPDWLGMRLGESALGRLAGPVGRSSCTVAYRPFESAGVEIEPGVLAARMARNARSVAAVTAALADAYGFGYRIVWLAAEHSEADTLPLYELQALTDSVVADSCASVPCFSVIAYERSGLPGEGSCGFSGLSAAAAESTAARLEAVIPL